MRGGRESSEAGDIADDDRTARARMHAALGEPVRLAIADRLTLGDVSPGELGAVTGLATNLLAHHLRVMEEAGLIRRVRSEGDRRRSYVQLRWDDDTVARLVTASAAASRPAGPVPRVLFVCTHNSARSQLAAHAWAVVSDIPAACAGTHPAGAVHPRAVEVGRRHGLRLDRSRTHRLADTVEQGDLIVAVCDNAHEALAAPASQSAGSDADVTQGRAWLHWAVADPVRVGTDQAFETAYTDLTHRIHRLAAALEPPKHSDRLAPAPRSHRRSRS
jgi:protein-tyrosine-phosphatase/DNA-binding transcriptional ArsR family regulator